MNPPVDPAAEKKKAEEKEQAEKEQAALRRMQDKIDRRKPLRFIVWALAAWWAIAFLADLVTTCVPGWAQCSGLPMLAKAINVLRSLRKLDPVPLAAVPSGNMTTNQWILLSISLCAALWVAKAAIYPNRDFGDELADAKAKLAKKEASAGKRVWFVFRRGRSAAGARGAAA